MTLLKKELKRTIFSLIWVIMTVVLVIFASTQGILPPEDEIKQPQPGGSYGMKASNDPSLIMPEATASLYNAFTNNSYVTYPNGFMKTVKLKKDDVSKMADIISKLTGEKIEAQTSSQSQVTQQGKNVISIQGPGDLTQDENGNLMITSGNQTQLDSTTVPHDVTFDKSVTWDEFSDLMLQADELLGGGSDYSQTYMAHRFGQIPVTYEEALKDYQLIVEKDKYTGAHARIFCDYMGIIMSLLPVFLAVYLLMKDRKNIREVIYTRQISSAKIVITRYLALIIASMLPVLILGVVLTIMHIASYGLTAVNIFAYLTYSLGWLLPTVMVSVAVGVFLTTLTNSPVAIAAQLVWWFVSIAGGPGSYTYVGGYSSLLAPRHNTLGQVQSYIDNFSALVQSRVTVAIIALILVGLTILIYQLKRKGSLNVSIFKHSKV